jgi:hypothetical protein
MSETTTLLAPKATATNRIIWPMVPPPVMSTVFPPTPPLRITACMATLIGSNSAPHAYSKPSGSGQQFGRAR